jgi:hypothetical protein
VLPLEPGGGAGAIATARIAWPKGRTASTVQAVSLASMLHAPPAQGANGSGPRNQSIAVSDVTFVYAAAGRGDRRADQSARRTKRIA